MRPQLDDQGQVLKNKKFSVIRTSNFLAYPDDGPGANGGFRQEKAPESIRAWLDRHPFLMSQIDPWVFYAKNIRSDEPSLQEFCDRAAAIQSAEGPGTILLRFRRGGDDARIELICDKTADCLPTKYRIGTLREGLWVPWAEESCEWRKTGEIWFPAHQVTVGYVGKEFKPVRFFDLTVRNLRVNSAADVPDSVFAPGTMLRHDDAGTNRNPK